MALAGKDAQIYVTDAQGQSTSMTDEGMDEVQASGPDRWQISDSAKNIFDPAHAMTLEVFNASNGSNWQMVQPSKYRIRYLLGIVESISANFGFSQNPSDARIDGHYIAKYTVLEGTTASIERTSDQYEVPRFGDGAQRRIQGLVDMSCEWEQFEATDPPIDGAQGTQDRLSEILTSGNSTGAVGSVDPLRVYSYQPDDSESELYRAWMKPGSISLDAPADDAITQTMNWQATEQSTTMSTQTAQPIDSIRYG